jgi:hypothetical protein
MTDDLRRALEEYEPSGTHRDAFEDGWRAALAARSEPPAEGLDVERLARAMHTTHIGDLHAAGEGWCGEEAAAIAREYAALAPEQPDAEHITYCRTCGKTRFVEWLHRNCAPEQSE